MFGFVSCSFNTSYTQMFLSICALLIAYIIIVCFMGYYRAWIAAKMGDNSAVDAGFLTLNPRKHISIQGLISLSFFRFGWGATQPHRPSTITDNATQVESEGQAGGRAMWTRLLIAYLSSPLLHLFMAVIEIIVLIGILGTSIASISGSAMLYGNISHDALMKMYPSHTALFIFIVQILISAIYIHVFSAVFNFLFRGSKIFMIYLAQKSPKFAYYHNFAKLFLSVIVILFFLTPQIRFLLVTIISNIGLLIARIFGAA